jgi:aryl-alcohol dehydrogenase-like predicted oxidoreductase
MQQLQENIASADVTLSAETLQQIEAVHLRCPNPAP